MGYATQRFSFNNTGSQTAITNLSGTPTGCRVTVCGNTGSNDASMSVGTCDGTRQNVQYMYGSGSNSTEIVHLKTEAGADQSVASWSSFTSSGGIGRVIFNVTTLDSTLSHTLEVWN